MRQLIGLFLAFAWLLCDAHAQPASTGEIPFEFRDCFLWIKVTTDSTREPLMFLLDSGATVSVLNTGTADRLNIHRGQLVQVHGVRTTTHGYWPATLRASAAGVSLPTRYLVTDLSELAKTCQGPIDGLLGADFFKNRIVQIDFAESRIRLLNASPAAETVKAVPLRSKGNALLVPVSVDQSERKWVRLDTGCTTSLQWVSGKFYPAMNRSRSVGLSRCAFPTISADIRLDQIPFQNVTVGLHSKPIFPGEAGLLGTALLSRFDKVTFDAKSGRLLLD